MNVKYIIPESWQKFKPTDMLFMAQVLGVFWHKTDLVQTHKAIILLIVSLLWTEILFILVIYEKYWNLIIKIC